MHLRFAAPLALAAALLIPPASAAQDRPANRATIKVSLQYVDVQHAVKSFPKLADPSLLILSYPLDNSVIMRGTPEAVDAVKSALATADVPIESNRLVITLRGAAPEVVRDHALALPLAGTVEVDGRTVRFQGQQKWLLGVRDMVLGEELSALGRLKQAPADRPLVGDLEVVFDLERKGPEGAAGGRATVRTHSKVEILLPVGTNLSVEANDLQFDAGRSELRPEGAVSLDWNQLRIQVRSGRVAIVREGPDGFRRITIEPLPPAPEGKR
jgi:hypothetical protein